MKKRREAEKKGRSGSNSWGFQQVLEQRSQVYQLLLWIFSGFGCCFELFVFPNLSGGDSPCGRLFVSYLPRRWISCENCLLHLCRSKYRPIRVDFSVSFMF